MNVFTWCDNRRIFMKALGMGACGFSLSNFSVRGQQSEGEKSVKTVISEGFGRIVVLRFERGENLLAGIRDKLKELGIRNAVIVSAIGTFEKVQYHRITSTGVSGKSEIFTVEAPIEFSSVDGLVIDGEPHFHLTFQDLDRAYSVHLENESSVCFLAEVVLAEIRGEEITHLRG